MEEQLNKIAKKIGNKIRTLLKEENRYEINVDFTISIGKYTVSFFRDKPEYEKKAFLIDFSPNFYKIIHECITEMDNLWKEEEENRECVGDCDTNGYSITCSIDGEVDYSGTISNLKDRVEMFQKLLKSALEREDYEKAAKIKKQVQDLESKISNGNSTPHSDGRIR